MMTLDEANGEALRRARVVYSNAPQPNGIECPYCKHELVDPDPHIVLPTAPMKKRVECPVCFFQSYRVL